MRRQRRSRAAIVIVCILLLIALVGAFFVWSSLREQPRRVIQHTGTAPAAADVRGIFANNAENGFFPKTELLAGGDVSTALESMIGAVAEDGFNTLLFDVYAGGTLYESEWVGASAMLPTDRDGALTDDPLALLTQLAHERDIAVIAVLSPRDYTGGDYTFADVLHELMAYYAVDGFAIRDAGSAELQQWVEAVRGYNNTLRIGVVDEAGALDMTEAGADYYFAPLRDSALGADAGYESALAELRAQASGAFVPVYDDALFAQPGEIALAFLYNRALGQAGFAYNDLTAFRALPQTARDELARQLADPGEPYIPPSNEFPQMLGVARPENSNNEATYSGSKYYLMGTSDPGSPVSVNGEEVELRASSGAFGLLVDLKYGKNTFVFEQNGESVTAVVTRPQSTGTGKITKITQSTMFPQSSDIAYAGGTYRFKCTAPGGSTVVASALGQSVTLSPAASASAGTPVTYTGRITLPATAAGAGEVRNAGKTKYTLTYNGTTTTYQSDGDLYVVGEGAKAAVRSADYLASVYNEANSNSGFFSTFNPGVCDYVVSSTDSYFELACGGFIQKSTVEVMTEGFASLGGTPTAVTLTAGARADTIRLAGSKGLPHRIYFEDDTLVWELFNIADMSDVDCADSAILDRVTVERQDDHLRLAMHFTDFDLLWGYDIDYEGDDTILYLKHSLQLSGDPLRPLAGLSIVVDPGHGANDPGALTFSGNNDPTEKSLNLDVSLALADILRSWGADVTMTRDDDSRIIIAERYPLSRSMKADMFISVHHNSVSENADANASAGTEVYYHNDLSATLADNIAANISQYVSRPNRGTYQRNFLVTRLFYAPAVLVEVGFLPNPFEAEQVIDGMTMYMSARAIADAIVETLA